MAEVENNNQTKNDCGEKFDLCLGYQTLNFEYETQFFGFTPKSFMDGGKLRFCVTKVARIKTSRSLNFWTFFTVYNAISDYISECFGELEKQLASEVGLTSLYSGFVFEHFLPKSIDNFDKYHKRESTKLAMLNFAKHDKWSILSRQSQVAGSRGKWNISGDLFHCLDLCSNQCNIDINLVIFDISYHTGWQLL